MRDTPSMVEALFKNTQSFLHYIFHAKYQPVVRKAIHLLKNSKYKIYTCVEGKRTSSEYIAGVITSPKHVDNNTVIIQESNT